MAAPPEPTCTDILTAEGVLSETVIAYICGSVDGLAGVTGEVASLSGGLTGTKNGLDVMFLLFSAYLVFMMQAGFAMVCAGSIRSKNCMNILLKNVLDSCVGVIGWYTTGFAFAFGFPPSNFLLDPDTPFKNANSVIGNGNFALSLTDSFSRLGADGNLGDVMLSGIGWHAFMFQWSFCAAATTIVSGAVAERCGFWAYLGYSTLLSAFVYPVIVHWHWSTVGFNSFFNNTTEIVGVDADGNDIKRGYIMGIGAIDFAGSGVVHMTGGVAAFMGAWIIGPRIGRFDASGNVNPMPGHNVTLICLGTFLLWFGWYGFNPGSNVFISSPGAYTTVARAAVCTTMSPAAAGLSLLFYRYIRTHIWDVAGTCNAVLAGLVAITAGCSTVEPWAALLCGALAGLIYNFGEWFVLHKLKVDDPVSAVGVHGFNGFFGVIFVGLLAKPQYVAEVYGGYGGGNSETIYAEGTWGAFYPGSSGKLLGCQCLEVALIMAWVGGIMFAFFMLMKFCRLLRVPVEVELAGLDVSKHGGSAYHGSTEMGEEAKA